MDGDGDLRSSNKGRKECRIPNILRRKEKPPLSGICETKGSGSESKAVGPLSLDLSHRLNSAGRRDSCTAPFLPPSPVLKASPTPISF